MRLTNQVSGVARYNNIIAQSARGCRLTDTKGKTYLDLTSGIGALSTGHCHPHVTKNVIKQCKKLVHAQQNCVAGHRGLYTFLDKFSAFLPSYHDGIYFCNSGTDAIENAVKLARKTTGKTNIITLMGGFHGRSLGAMSLSTSRTSCRQGYQPLMPGVFHLDFPFHGETDYNIEQLETLTQRATSPEETAAIIIEPILGEGGIVQIDYNFAQYLNDWCYEHNVMLICDEVQTGCARTGNWWAHSELDLDPDIIVFAKGIASGYPLAGITSNINHFDTIHANGLGGTYNANAVAIAAANATMDVLSPILQDIKHRGSYFAGCLRALNHPMIEEVRDFGMMIAVEIDLPANVFQEKLRRCHESGILMLSTGVDSTLRLLPPLIISKSEIDEAVDHIEHWLDT
jgi:4-aminobutyrate aminotransferase